MSFSHFKLAFSLPQNLRNAIIRIFFKNSLRNFRPPCSPSHAGMRCIGGTVKTVPYGYVPRGVLQGRIPYPPAVFPVPCG